MIIRSNKTYKHLVVVEQQAFGMNTRKFQVQTGTTLRQVLVVGNGVYYPSSEQYVCYFRKPWTRTMYRLVFTSRDQMIEILDYVLNTKHNFWKTKIREFMTYGQLTRKKDDNDEFWTSLD